MSQVVLPSAAAEIVTPRICPACHAAWSANRRVRVQTVDDSDELGVGTALASLKGSLVYARCDHCQSLIAIDARRDPTTLDQIYRDLPDAYWSHLNPQDRFAGVLEAQLLRRHTSGDVWDIGCGTGTLLAAMSDRWTKHGIEPGARAVAAAQARGFDVRQGTALQLGMSDAADVALLIDVIEHMPDPQLELEAVCRMLRPGGTLAVFTGRADAVAPRLSGKMWYYLHCVGHVTVFSTQALRGLMSRLGLTQIESLRVEHQGAVGLRRWLGRAGGNAARVMLGRRAAPMHFYRDHQLVLATKPR